MKRYSPKLADASVGAAQAAISGASAKLIAARAAPTLYPLWRKLCRALVMLISICCHVGINAAAAQPTGALTLRDDRGVELNFAASPQRIISLLPSVTESVCALGACKRLIGTDRFSNSPPEVIALPKLGGLEDAQIERIVSLKPDVVLAAKSARVTERLESLGLKVVVLESQTHADVKAGQTAVQ